MNVARIVCCSLLLLVSCSGLHAEPAASTDVDRAAALYLEGDPAAAVPLLESSIRSIEQENGTAHQDLVVPLGFLGAAYHDLERHEEALATLARAREIARAHEGEHNRTQLPLVYVEAESLQALGRVTEAEKRQREAVEIVRRHDGADSMEAALALGRLAEWLGKQRHYDESLILFSQAIDQARRAAGGDDIAMMPLLQAMAVVQLAGSAVPERALSLMQLIVDLTDAHSGFGPEPRIEARLLQGDLFMRFSREPEALQAYTHAWRIANEAGDRKWLQKLAAPRKAAGRLEPVDETPEDRTYYVFEYDLRTDGRPGKVSLVESNASKTIADWALQQFREMRFQPPLVAGKPQAAEGLTGVFIH